MGPLNVTTHIQQLTRFNERSSVLSAQVVPRMSAQHPPQCGGAPHGPAAPAGPDWHQPGEQRRGQHPAADHRGQLTENMTGVMYVA